MNNKTAVDGNRRVSRYARIIGLRSPTLARRGDATISEPLHSQSTSSLRLSYPAFIEKTGMETLALFLSPRPPSCKPPLLGEGKAQSGLRNAAVDSDAS